jgi:peptidyl-tRNA hydrolase, PTH2 family
VCRRPGSLKQWEHTGQAKICLKAASDVELRTLAAAAGDIGIPFFIVQDAGRTQVAAGSRTVLALGPAPKSLLDKVTGHLKLL